MLKLNDQPVDPESIRRYQAESLGRFGGQTLLAELMPIPKPGIGAWGYESLIPQFRSREDYCQQIKPRQLALLQGLLREHRPRQVAHHRQAHFALARLLPAG
jgi:hypothetical protein